MTTKRDYENILYTAEQRGLQAGLAQGRAEGEKMGVEKVREEMSNENALRMLKKGYSVSDISEVTGLSEEDVRSLMNCRARV